MTIEEFGFSLHKSAFHDALALRYNWQPVCAPFFCGCGVRFSLPKGGFPSIRHNEIRDLKVNLLSEVCNDVCIERDLQPLTGEVLTGASSNVQDGARLDIAANGVWGGWFERTYFDVRVFNPHAPSHRQTNLSTCYRRQESVKKRAYQQRIRDIACLFHPTCPFSYWRFGKRSHYFLQKVCFVPIAAKWDCPHSSTMSWLRCRLTFALLHSAIQCVRGARSCCGHAFKFPPPMDPATSELHLT